MISIIACMSQPTRVIGKNGGIPWHLPPDFQWFKKNTFNKPIIMGRSTWESLSLKPLPGRLNVVLSTSEEVQDNLEREYSLYDKTNNTGLIVSDHIERAITAAKVEGKVHWNTNEIFIIGGEETYRHAMARDLVDRMYITYIEQSIEGDTYFPNFNIKEWDRQWVDYGAHNELKYSFWIYEKRRVDESRLAA